MSEGRSPLGGVWGHAPPENFGILSPLRCHFLLSDRRFHFSLAAEQEL